MIFSELGFWHKLAASFLGALIGSLFASGIGELLGVDWNGGVWYDWAIAAFWIGTCLAFPLALILIYSLVPLLFNKLRLSSSTQNLYVSSGLAAILVVLLPYSVIWLDILSHRQSIYPTLPSMLIFLSYSLAVGLLTMFFLNQLYQKYRASFLN